MDLGLKGCKAIVTGGTKGIGRAIALMLADEGTHVSVCARTKADVEATVKTIKGKGVGAHGAALDLADAAALKTWVDDAAKALGGIDIVVANASALAIPNTPESWKREFEVDLMGTVHACEHALPYLEKSKAGAIVVISSVSGVEADVVAGPYGSTKGALIHYAKGLACRLAPKGIRANTVSPGTTYFEGGVWHQIEQNNPELFKLGLSMNKMGRMATAEEVANGAVFLASPRASFITGTNLLVDGALTNKVA
ncbi:MAG: SDR family oxidoreductase [Alphaproteobacteria bacterium]|nr:SDR family oxidoreductase [Alphaproteobacteria bacterium]